MKNYFSIFCSLLAFASFSQAAVILSDDFTLASDPSGTSTATITAWYTENGVNAGTSFSAFENGGSSANYFSDTSALSIDATVWSSGDGWDVTYTFALDAGTASISLTTLDLSAIVTNNSGGARSGGGDREWTFEVTGDAAYGTQSASVTSNFNNSTSPTGQIDLSGLGNLVAGENYTASIGVRYVNGDQTYMALDSMTINGDITPVPEPSSLTLIALAGTSLLLIRRRR